MFQTTQWSMIRAAGADSEQGRTALATLCGRYRPAALAYLRACGCRAEEAEDLVQAFFLRFLEKRLHASADPHRGRFRVFLRVALHNFVANEQVAAGRLRRQPPGFADGVETDALESPEAGPERAFERAWTLAVLDRALARLRAEARASGREALFDALAEFLVEAPAAADYARIAAATGMRTNSIAVATHRLRARLRAAVEEELRETVHDEDGLRAEMARLTRASR